MKMEKEDRELIKLLNDSKKGNKNSFEKFTRLVYQEVYNLVAFVYITKESREKLTKHVLVRMFKNASEFDNEELDIHLWIARFTTVEVYNVCKKQNGELFDTQISAEEYNYDSISEDSEFAKCAADYNQAFLDIDQLNEIMTDFEDFSKGQRLLYLMFAYESYTIDEIEDLIDSTFIGTQIMQIRGMLGLDMVSLDGDGSQVHVADEDSSEDETDDEDSSDDSVPEIDFDDNDNYSDRYDAKSANHGIKADARMRGIIAICAALVVVLAVVTVAIAGRIKKNKSKSTFNPTPVTTAAEEATTKKSSKNNNATTKAAETTTTKAAETDEQTEAATTRRTQTKTNDTEAAGDTEDGGNAGGSGSGDSGSADGSGSGDSGDTGGSGSGDSGDTDGSGSGDSGDTGGSGSGDSGDTGGSGSGDSGSTGGSGSGDSGSTGGSGSGDSGSTGGSGSDDSGSTGGSGSGDSGSTGGSGSGDSGSTGGSGSGDSGSTGGSGSGDSGNTGGSESGSETGSSEAAGN